MAYPLPIDGQLYFLRPVNGSDTNDGRDFHGFALTAGTYDDTGHADGEKHLSEVGAFTGYTWTDGDSIYLSGGAGITAGIYEIASKFSDDAILLATSAGSDSTADVTSSNGAFKTFQKLADTLPANAEGRCCLEGSAPHETYSAQIDMDGNIGLTTGAISVCAASATNGVRVTGGDKYTITWDTSVTRCMYAGSNMWKYWHHYDIKLDFAGFNTSNAISGANGGSMTSQKWVRCHLLGDGLGSGAGVFLRSSGHTVIDCIFEDLGGAGLRLDAGSNTVVNSAFINNSSEGLYLDATTFVSNCRIMGNGTNGIYAVNNVNTTLMNNVIYGNSDSGLFLAGSHVGDNARVIVMGNIFAKNGAFGIDVDIADFGGIVEGSMSSGMDFNHFWNNTSGAASNAAITYTEANINTNDRMVFGVNNVTGDPGFTSETPGSEDFLPDSTSSVLIAAMPSGLELDDFIDRFERTIGPNQPAYGAGGGGGSAVARHLRIN